jgi:hypothetical protein
MIMNKKKFTFTGTKIQEEYGTFTIEAESLKEAMDRLHEGFGNFKPQKNRCPKVMVAELRCFNEKEIIKGYEDIPAETQIVARKPLSDTKIRDAANKLKGKD